MTSGTCALERRDYVFLTLMLVGIIRIFSYYADTGIVSRFARTLAISPNPSPFRTVRSWPGTFEHGLTIECVARDGSSVPVKWDANVRSRLELPQRMLSFYGQALSVAGETRNTDEARGLLERLFCSPTALAHAFGCGNSTTLVRYRYTSFYLDVDRARKQYEVRCEERS